MTSKFSTSDVACFFVECSIVVFFTKPIGVKVSNVHQDSSHFSLCFLIIVKILEFGRCAQLGWFVAFNIRSDSDMKLVKDTRI
jgi:hypothetical protein